MSTLGCVCFGFKLISEMLFRKIGCLVGPENWVKLKMFLVLTIKQEQWGGKYFLSLFSLQTISGDAQRKKGLTDAQTQGERESSSTSTPTKPRSRLTSTKLRPAQPSSDHAGPLPRSRVGQTPKTHKHQSTQISAHPSLIIDPPLQSPAMHR